jgi:hypothetical protein
VPSKIFEQRNISTAEAFAQELLPFVVPNVRAFTEQFRPTDIPTSDLMRGMFMIGQSSNTQFIETQIRRHIQEALYYFSSEFLLASEHGFDYTSTFNFEEHICQNGLSALIKRRTGARVYKSMLTSKFPLYQGLTPEIIAQIRDDDNYAAFRRELFHIYTNVSDDESNSRNQRNIREAEEAHLRPILESIERSEKSGSLSRLGFSRLSVVRLAATVLFGVTVPGLDSLTSFGILGEIIERFAQRHREQGAIVIWKKLFNHKRNIKQEFSTESQENPLSARRYWGVSLKDGLTVTITEGIYPSKIKGNDT